MSLLDLLKAKVAESEQEQAQTQEQAWADYRAILERRENPEPADVDRALALVKTLGIPRNMIDVHAQVLDFFAGKRAAADRLADLTREEQDIDQQMTELDRRLKEVRDAIQPLIQRKDHIEAEKAGARAADQDARHAAFYFPRLLPGEARGLVPPAPIPPAPITNTMREAGIRPEHIKDIERGV